MGYGLPDISTHLLRREYELTSAVWELIAIRMLSWISLLFRWPHGIMKVRNLSPIVTTMSHVALAPLWGLRVFKHNK